MGGAMGAAMELLQSGGDRVLQLKVLAVERTGAAGSGLGQLEIQFTSRTAPGVDR
jgi:hypothetical protein